MEKCITVWTNELLSRGGHLVLVKPVLGIIPVYRTSIYLVPKGILNNTRKLSFRFLWIGEADSKGISLVSQAFVARVKYMGG